VIIAPLAAPQPLKQLAGDARSEWATALGLTREELQCEIPLVVRTSVDRAISRLQEQRSRGDPDVVIENERKRALLMLTPGWRAPPVDLEGELIADAMASAAIIDLERQSGPLPSLSADIAGFVLMAAQCCAQPDARALESETQSSLEWKDLGRPDELDDAPVAEGHIAVRPNFSNEVVERLAHALLPPRSPFFVVAPGGALFEVTLVDNHEDDDA